MKSDKFEERPAGDPLVTRLLATCAFAGLSLGSISYLSGEIDDEYIVYAYAHHIVKYGEVAWNTGMRVEGYSSPLHLFLLVLGCLAGFDLSILSRVLSFIAASATISLMLHRRFGTHRGWLVFLVATWQPFQHWAVAGLETATATFIGTAGWALVFCGRRSWAFGIVLLTAFSLLRPEGVAWLAAGLCMRPIYQRTFGRPELVAAASIAILTGYHVLRFSYFDALLPTPWLVKIVAIGNFRTGVREASLELLSGTPLLIMCALLRKEIPKWVWIPLFIQVSLLIRANGDWMGHSRLLLPGVIASVGAAMVSGQPRQVHSFSQFALSGFACFTFMWEAAPMQGLAPRWRDISVVLNPSVAFHTVWKVPLLKEAAFMIERIPEGAAVQIADVGLPGNIDDIKVWDGAGLTDRVVAEMISSGDYSLSPTLMARFDDPDGIWCIRYGIDANGMDPADPWLTSKFPDVATQPDARGLFWRCRNSDSVSFDLIMKRWKRLLDRFPNQDEIRLQYARSRLDGGMVNEGLATAHDVGWANGQADGWLVFRPQDDSDYVIDRGWPLYQNSTIQSVPMSSEFWSEHAVTVDVDDPGVDGAQVTLRWNPPCGESSTEVLKEMSTIHISPCVSVNSSAIVIGFENDVQEVGVDRNVYVTLSPYPPTPGQ